MSLSKLMTLVTGRFFASSAEKVSAEAMLRLAMDAKTLILMDD